MKKIILLIGLFLLSITISAQIGGYALKFDGVDDYVSIPDNANIDFTSSDSYTIEAWVYANSLAATNNGRAVLSKWNSSDGSYFIRINTGGDIWFDNLYTSTGVITTNKWYHIACVYKSGTGAYRKVFVNGVEKSLSGTFLGPNDGNSEPLKIGRHLTYANDWNGRIDEVRIWNVARTADEIRANMYKELAGNETGLSAYYKMSDGQLTTLNDDSQNDNTGTLTNDPTWVTSGCFAGSRNALDFDGSNDYIDFTNDPPYSNSAITLEAWIKLTSSGTELEIMSWDNPHATEFRVNEGKLQFGIDATGWTSVISSTNVNTGNWTHVAMVKSNTTVKLYINGMLDAIGTQTQNPTAPDFQIAHLYEGGSKYYFPGQIDEVRIWNTARTESEIRENMMKNLVGNETGLIAYYRFDNYDGTTLYDITNNGRNGTLTNMDAASDWVSSSAFNIWIGSESNAWATAANWTSGYTPASSDNIGVYKWALGNELIISGEPTVSNMLISSTAVPTLNSNLNISNNLILQNNLNLNGQTINLTGGSLVEGTNTLTGTSGNIVANRASLGTYSSLTNLFGLGLEIKSSGNLGNTVITRGVAQQTTGGLSNSIKRYYDVTVSGGNPYDIIFHYNESELTGSESDLSLFKSTDVGTSWLKISDSRNTTDNTVSFTGLTSFSRFTLADGTSPLPIELQSLKAITKNNKVIITWQTATEINNYGFEIERAQVVEGKTGEYNKIGFIQGYGNSNTIIDYTFADVEVKYGKYSYRLKQIDNDGKYNYSNSVETEINNITNYTLSQNYPNPFNPSTTISYEIPKTTNVSIKVYNILGKEVATLVNEKQETGVYNIEFNGSNLSSGIYYYKLETEGFSQVKKMTLIK